jgi:hypothetical protein
VEVAAERFPAMNGFTDAEDKAAVGIGPRVLSGDEVISLKYELTVFAVTAANVARRITENASPVALDDDHA